MRSFCYDEDLDLVNLGLRGNLRTGWNYGQMSTLQIEGLSGEVGSSGSASWRRWVRGGLEGAEERGLSLVKVWGERRGGSQGAAGGQLVLALRAGREPREGLSEWCRLADCSRRLGEAHPARPHLCVPRPQYMYTGRCCSSSLTTLSMAATCGRGTSWLLEPSAGR